MKKFAAPPKPVSVSDKPMTCPKCYHTFARHPSLEVDCPICDAKQGERCRKTEKTSPYCPEDVGKLTYFCQQRYVAAVWKGLIQECRGFSPYEHELKEDPPEKLHSIIAPSHRKGKTVESRRASDWKDELFPAEQTPYKEPVYMEEDKNDDDIPF